MEHFFLWLTFPRKRDKNIETKLFFLKLVSRFEKTVVYILYDVINNTNANHLLNSLTDKALMLKVKSGDTQKLGLLYERYKKWIFNFFNQMFQDPDASEDLVQNVFMRILKYKHTYTEESKFVTWIFQIARNEGHDYYNKHIKNKQTLDIDHAIMYMPAKDEIMTTIEERESNQMLYKAIDKLPIDKREIIVLSKLKQLKYKDIGVILDCNEEAARTRSHRALKDLKKIYFELQKVS